MIKRAYGKISTAMKITLDTGTTIDRARDESILDALKREGIYLVASCGGKGVCGKCRVRVLEGDPASRGEGKLTENERADGIVLACTSYPEGDVKLSIPDASRLVVGDKIATAKAEHLHELFASFDVKAEPLLKTVELRLEEPTINDNISDLERLRRALDDAGFGTIRFSHGFTRSLAARLRDPDWKITLGCFEDVSFCEAVFVKGHGH